MSGTVNITPYTIISGTSENDWILNGGQGESVLIYGDNGDDTINNRASYVKIEGGQGNDSIHNFGSFSKINGGDGNDSISSCTFRGRGVEITGGNGNDFIYNDGTSGFAIIDGGAGNDKIDNGGDSTTINGGSGNDYIRNGYYYFEENQGKIAVSSVSVNGGTGNDTIDSKGDDITINSGKGNDLISLDSNSAKNLIQYASGDGNDIIQGFNSTSTLSIGGGTYSTKKSGDDIIVTVGDGKISLIGAASLDTINIKGTKLLTVTRGCW